MFKISEYQNSLLTQYKKSAASMNIKVNLFIHHKNGTAYILETLAKFVEHNSYFLYYINSDYEIAQNAQTELVMQEVPVGYSKGIDFFASHVNEGIKVSIQANHILYDGRSMLNIINGIIRSLNAGTSYQLEDGSAILYERSLQHKKVMSPAFSQDSLLHHIQHKNDAYVTDRFEHQIDEALMDKIKVFCQREKISLPLFFIGMLGWIFQHDFVNRKVSIGTVVDVRMTAVEKDRLGLGINTIPIVIPVDDATSDTYFLQLKKHYFHAMKHAYVSQKFTGYKPNILFSYQQANILPLQDGSLTFTWDSLQNSAIPLAFTLSENEKDADIYIDYNASIYSSEKLENKIARLFVLIEQIIAEANTMLPTYVLSQRDIKMLDALQGEQIMDKHERNVYDIIVERWQELADDKSMVICKDVAYTFSDVYGKMNKLAQFLTKNKVTNGDFVGISVESPLTNLVAILALWKIGSIFVPIDPSLPRARSEEIKKQCQITTVIDEQYFIQSQEQAIEQQESDWRRVRQEVEKAYVIFTSGTTGTPRGCVQTHRNLTNHLLDNTMQLTEDSTFLQAMKMTFDVSLMGIVALMHGATVVLQDQAEIRNPGQTMDNIQKYRVSALNTTTAIFEQWVPQYVPVLKDVDSIMVGGEELKNTVVQTVFADLQNKLINGYGPTETTIFSVVKRINEIPNHKVPIGNPIVNTKIKILDVYDCYVGIGELGELCIAGRGVGAGYVGSKEETNEKFRLIDNEMTYLTGDLCYVDFNGDLVFLGRKDQQVKMNGFRIDPLEIVHQIERMPNIARALVLKIDNSLVCGYMVVNQAETITQASFKQVLSKQLAPYMIPSRYIALKEFVLTENGKINVPIMRQQLIEQMEAQIAHDRTYDIASLAKNEQTILTCWESVLHVSPLSKDETLEQSGATSLDVIRLYTALNNVFVEQIEFEDFTNELSLNLIADKLKTVSLKNESIDTSALPAVLNVTTMQKSIFLADMKNANSTKYNVPIFIKLSPIDYDKFTVAVHTLCAELSELNVNFYASDEDVTVKTNDMKFSDMQQIVLERIEDAFAYIKPFQLEHDELIRFFLFTTPTDRYFLIDSHHIIMDGISLNTMLQRIDALYKGTTSSAKITSSFAQYSIFEQKHRGDRNFWTEQLTESEKYKLVCLDNYHTTEVENKNRSQTISGIMPHIRAKNFDVNTYVLLCIGLLVAMHGSEQKNFVGLTMSGRVQPEFAETKGLLLNTIPFIYDYNLFARKTFKAVYAEISKQIKLAAFHQFFDFNTFMREMKLVEDNDVFDVLVNIREDFIPLKFGEIVVADIQAVDDVIGQKFPLTIEVIKGTDDLELIFQYNNAKFKEQEITTLFQTLVRMFETIYEYSENDIIYQKTLQLFTKKLTGKRMRAVKEFTSVYDAFYEHVALRPEHIAIETRTEKISYRELHTMCVNLAVQLQKKYNIQEGDRVGLFFTKEPEMIITMLTCAMIGATYVPINLEFPTKLQDDMCKVAQTKILLGNIDSPMLTEKIIWKKINSQSISADWHEDMVVSTGKTPFYLLFTSGTTGKPKGIEITNDNVINFMKNNFQNIKEKRSVLFSDYSFDGSVYDIYSPLLNGGTLILVDDKMIRNPDQLCDIVKEKKLTTFFMPAAYFNALSSTHYEMLQLLDVLFIGGEQASSAHLRQAFPVLSGKVFNAYGPTEATAFTTIKKIEERDVTSGVIPIGKPLNGITIQIIDRDGHMRPPYAIGEIIIGGASVANGYINGADSAFDEKKKTYSSGDLGYYNEKQEVVYVRRKIERQIKLRGYRIELGAIEYAILKTGFVSNTHVVYDKDSGKLCMFLVDKRQTFVIKDLINSLRKYIPEYMIPKFYQVLSALPLNKNGKVDRGKFNISETRSIYEEAEDSAGSIPTDPLRAKIYRIWTDVLDVNSIKTTDNFFELGGYSLQAMKIVSSLKRFGFDISMQDIIDYPVFGDFCDHARTVFGKKMIETHQDNFYSLAEDVQIKRINKLQSKIQVVVLPTYMLNFAYAMIFENVVKNYNRQIEWDICNFASVKNFIEMYAAKIAEIMNTNKKVLLLGYSFGGCLAYEVAHVLSQRYSKIVDGIIMLDSYFKVTMDTGLEFFMDDLSDRAQLREKLIEFFPVYSELAEEVQEDVETTFMGFMENTITLKNNKYDLPTTLHFLEAEFQDHGMKDTRDEWFNNCFTQTEKYLAAGQHNDMLNEENVDNNFKIIEKIIEKEVEK